MSTTVACPLPQQWQQFLLGQLAETEVEHLRQHLAWCGGCLWTMQNLPAQDDLVVAVQAGLRATTWPEDEVSVTLVARLCRLRQGVERAEVLSFLGPPQEPGEIGRIGDYRILKVLGSGGMGLVYQAWQPRLQRLVALKVSRGGPRTSQERLVRFLSETEIIARLQHPNIVPVHEAGEHEGQPYYTMEFLEGGSLAQKFAVAPLPARAAADLVATLARAVQFAHDHGFIHRDLKPANVLLSSDGVPKISDFGLAKQLVGDADTPGAERRTESGAILGTPSYMAPEQARGSNEAVGPAADVYALGAILYEALTGQPPFKAATVLETLEQVRSQEPVPPGRWQRSVPRDLETICLKCLEKDPRRRYASASDLAHDMGRFLAGEPIRARAVRPWERAGKWARRRPTAAALVVVSVLAVLGLVAGVLVHNAQLRRAVERAEANEADAARQRSLAEARYRAAYDSHRRMLNRLDDERLAGTTRLQELRRELLEDALIFYQAVLKQVDHPDPAIRLDAVFALVETAAAQYTQGRTEPARENFQRAVALLESLSDEDRDRPTSLHHLAICHNHLGRMAHVASRWDEAERHYKVGLGLFERLDREQPNSLRWQNELARSDALLGHLHENAGRLGRAATHYLRAVARREKLVAAHPANAGLQVQLAETYQNLGTVYGLQKRWPEAREVNDKARRLLEPLADAKHLAYQLSLAAVYFNAGNICKNTGKKEEALKWFNKAVELAEAVLLKEPQLADAVERGYSAHGGRAQAHELLGCWAEAAEDWGRVVALERGPNAWMWRLAQAVTLARAGQHARAAAEAEALEKEPKALASAPHDVVCVYALALAAARKDVKLSAAERQLLADRYGARAMALLQKLAAQGYFQDAGHARALATDEDLQALHEREDFQQLQAKVQPRKPRSR